MQIVVSGIALDKPPITVVVSKTGRQGPTGDVTPEALQARDDAIAAAAAAEGAATGTVRFDMVQTLTDPQKAQARENVGLAPQSYMHLQSVASAVWTVVHGLRRRPAVFVEDSAGTDVEGEINHVDENTVVLTFSAPFSGVAHLS